MKRFGLVSLLALLILTTVFLVGCSGPARDTPQWYLSGVGQGAFKATVVELNWASPDSCYDCYFMLVQRDDTAQVGYVVLNKEEYATNKTNFDQGRKEVYIKTSK